MCYLCEYSHFHGILVTMAPCNQCILESITVEFSLNYIKLETESRKAYTGKSKINSAKNCVQWDNTPLTTLASYVLDRRFLKWPLLQTLLHILDFNHFWNQQSMTLPRPERFKLTTKCWLPSSVSRALMWWSRDPGFNSHWGKFLGWIYFALFYVSPIWHHCQLCII